MAIVRNKVGGEVEFYRFPGSEVGIVPNHRTAEGDDVFEEYEFLKALWLLYPNGLPIPKEPLTKQEKQIRALTVFFMNEEGYDETPYTVDNYDEMMSYWDISGPIARQKAEKMLAVVEDVED